MLLAVLLCWNALQRADLLCFQELMAHSGRALEAVFPLKPAQAQTVLELSQQPGRPRAQQIPATTGGGPFLAAWHVGGHPGSGSYRSGGNRQQIAHHHGVFALQVRHRIVTLAQPHGLKTETQVYLLRAHVAFAHLQPDGACAHIGGPAFELLQQHLGPAMVLVVWADSDVE